MMISKARLMMGAAKAVAFASRHVPSTNGFQYFSRGVQAKATRNNCVTEATKFVHAVM